ncbi:MAG: L,D-transpeptidase [Candidatus Aminicenantes bacterium]|nr:L,D-transpeptidase [Candidatus Aminicenantes bacterium]
MEISDEKIRNREEVREINKSNLEFQETVKKPKFKGRKTIYLTLYIAGLYLILNIIGVILFWPKNLKIEESGELNLSLLEREISLLDKRLSSQRPKGVYILIDSGANRLFLKKNDDLIREAIISCGSGSILEEPGGKRRWVFDTPRGEFTIKSKIVNPDWIKPDWAFIEEGKEPPKNWKERVESGVLGDYALGFGQGYFIHGTLYTRLLGRNVTHGCIRVGDEDLEIVYKNTQIGTKIYIF